MAQIVPIDVLKGISGKYGDGSNDYFATNSSSYKIRLAKLNHPYKGPYTTGQVEQQAKFAATQAAITAWLNANKPSATNGAKGTTAYQFLKKMKLELHLSNVTQVLRRYIDDNNVISLPTVATGGTGTGSGTGTGGSGTGSGGTQQGGGGNSGNTPAGNVTITLTSADATQGKVQINTGEVGATATVTVASGTSTVIKAIPEAGYTFSKWSDNALQFERTITPTEDTNLTATFEAE